MTPEMLEELKAHLKLVEHECLYKEDIGYIKATLQSLDDRINGSMDSVKRHIEEGGGWRKAIVGIIFAGIVQVVSFAYLFGLLSNQVSINTDKLKEIENHVVR